MRGAHPLVPLLRDLAAGRPPPPDGGLQVLPAPPGPADGVLAFTAHHVVAADVDPAWVHDRVPPGDLVAPMSPAFLAALGERLGSEPGVLDVVFVGATRAGRPPLDLEEVAPYPHPRLDRALAYRVGVRAFRTRDGAGVLAVGHGLAGRVEAAFEVDPDARGRGIGRALAVSALHLAPPGEPVFMQAAVGNVASVRAILGAGLVPVGGEVLFLR